MMRRKTTDASALPASLLVFSLLFFLLPSSAFPQAASGAVTKGTFIERFFLNKLTRPPAARAYVPEGVEALSPDARYAAVVNALSGKGVMSLVGTRPGDPLTRVEYITLTYLLAGGAPRVSFAEQKAFLKAKGVIPTTDIGFIKSYQGEAKVKRAGSQESQRITGAEPVMFKDLDETEFGARLELQFDDGSTLTIGEDTALTIDEMVYDPKTKRRSISLRVTVGKVRIKATENNHPDSKFEVITPSIVVGVRGTELTLDVDESGKSRLITIVGLVGVRPNIPAGPQRGGARPQQPQQTQEVIVSAGQTTEVSVGVTVPPVVVQATITQITQATQATRVITPAPVASVTADTTQQTANIVQVIIREPAVSTVESKQETGKRIEQNIQSDKSEATQEVATAGSTGESKLTTSTTPKTAETAVSLTGLTGADLTNFFNALSPSVQTSLLSSLTATQAGTLIVGRTGSVFTNFFNGLTAAVQTSLLNSLTATQAGTLLVGRTGSTLKTTFLGFTDAVQADNFGGLTSSQQADLVGLFTQQEAEDLLARFKPSSPFTAAVLKSLLDFGFTLSSTQLGQLIDNVTVEQGVEFTNCTESTRSCVHASDKDWFSGARVLTAFGAGVVTALARELNRLAANSAVPIGGEQFLLSSVASGTTISSGSSFTGPGINAAWEIIHRVSALESPVLATEQHTIDIWGGGFRPAAHTLNGGYQAGQLRPTHGGGTGSGLIDTTVRQSGLNGNGFLSYAVQVEEDIVNSLALSIRSTSVGSFIGTPLDAVVTTALTVNDIRARDATLAAQADARAGLVLRDSSGNRVRVQQYVYRPPSNTDEVRMTSIALNGATGLSYIDLRVAFQSGQLSSKTAQQIRDLPWNSYFTVLLNGDPSTCQVSQSCEPAIGSPSGSPLIGNILVEMGNGSGDFIREEMTGFGSQVFGENHYNFAGDLLKIISDSVFHQHPTQLKLTTRKGNEVAKPFTVGNGASPVTYDPRAGSTLSSNLILGGEFRVIPRQFLSQGVASIPSAPTGRPDYFHYVVNDGGTILHYPITFAVLGDATTASNAGLQTATCGSGGATACATLHFDNIWDAFRVNQTAATNNPQSLPTINIGANTLQITAGSSFVNASSATVQVLSAPIQTHMIPWPRMIWRGESDF